MVLSRAYTWVWGDLDSNYGSVFDSQVSQKALRQSPSVPGCVCVEGGVVGIEIQCHYPEIAF